MSRRFYFPDEDDESSVSSEDNLPFPKPFTRASFLTPDFDATTFLSTLHNRHQTLEDLRTELRTRSQDLNKELLDLVNENYQNFLSLGSSLQGGDEKVEEVRLGLFGFKREVEGLRGKIDSRRAEVEGLVEERKSLREQIQVGRQLLEVETRIGELEERLMLAFNSSQKLETNREASWSGSEESDEEEDGSIAVSKLQRHVQQYLYIRQMIERIGEQHPFLIKQEDKVLRLKQTILLDLSSALKQVIEGGEEYQGILLKILETYRQLGQVDEAVKVLKELRQRQL